MTGHLGWQRPLALILSQAHHPAYSSGGGTVAMDNWLVLIPLVISVGVPIVLFALRHLIVAWISKRVQHNFDVKMETLKTTLRNNEEELKSELRYREAEIASLRDKVFSASVGRQAIVDRRRLEAVEKIWTAVNDMAQLKSLSQTMAIVNYDVVSREINDPKIRKFVEMLGISAPDLNNIKNIARDEQPFVPEILLGHISVHT
jgi:hypothetical protein